jgi:GT2 family glycosyltransferase
LVQSIVSQDCRDWELIVAVQGEDDQLIDYVTHQAQNNPRISFVHLDQYSKSHALNQAVTRAKADIIAFTDDDCVASKEWLATINNCFALDHNVGIVAGNLLPPPASPFRVSTCPATFTIECVYKPSEENGFAAPPGFYWGGGNFAVRRSIFDLVGLFDEYLGPGTEFPGAEDVDFCLRAEAQGVVMWTTPQSVIYHTYGRRYGIQELLKYHRMSAIGSGALGAKLHLWNHRLAREWGKSRRPAEWARQLVKNPYRALLEMYKARYVSFGHSKYVLEYDIDESILTRPKPNLPPESAQQPL